MLSTQSSSSDPPGRMQVLPNGQHRWVPESAQPGDSLPEAVPTLAYQPAPARRTRWWAAPLAFILGMPLGMMGVGGAVVSLWSIRLKSTPAPALFVACVVTILCGGVCLHVKRTFAGWLAFGTGVGLFAAAFLTLMFWGWRDC